jgi:hypothetical protein
VTHQKEKQNKTPKTTTGALCIIFAIFSKSKIISR